MNETRKSRQGKKRVLKTVLAILLIVMVGVVAYFFKAYSDIGSTAESIYNEVSVVEMREESIEVETATQPISFLLLGADTGTAEEERTETGRSDTIIVCTVNPNTKTTTLLSIPRDSYAEIVGYSDVYDYYGDYYDKMNHAYAFGGTEMSINTVQEFLNVPIDYYVEVNFDGLVDIVDAVGGIEITSPLTFDFYGPQFIEGETRILTGFEALQFARMRKQDPDGDLGRQARQQMVIKAILDKALTMLGLAAPRTTWSPSVAAQGPLLDDVQPSPGSEAPSPAVSDALPCARTPGAETSQEEIIEAWEASRTDWQDDETGWEADTPPPGAHDRHPVRHLSTRAVSHSDTRYTRE